MSRTRRVRVSGLPDVSRQCREHHIAGLVLDVEPFLAHWGCAENEYSAGIERGCRYLRETVPSLRFLAVATNARRQWRPAADLATVEFVGHARKPWTTSWVRRARRPLAVVGDTIVTDGLLAARSDALFLQYARVGAAPLWPRIQSWVGCLIAPLLFEEVSGVGRG